MKHIICVVDIHTNRRTVEIDTVCPNCNAVLTEPNSLRVASLNPVLLATFLAPAEDNGFSPDITASYPNEIDPDIPGLGYLCARCGHELASGAWVAE